MSSPSKINSILFRLLWLVLLWVGLAYLGKHILTIFTEEKEFLWPELNSKNIGLIGLLLVMMVANWSFEAFKWKYAIRTLEKQSFYKALKATLIGVMISSWMPNRMGEYLGKVFFVRPKNRVNGVIGALYISLTQIVSTLFFGLLGGIYFLAHFQNHGLDLEVLSSAFAFLTLGFFALFNQRGNIWNKLMQYKAGKAVHIAMKRFGKKEFSVLTVLSTLRLWCFSAQMLLCLELFNFDGIGLACWMLILLLYGLQTIIPSTALVSLGLRGSLALFLLGFVGQNSVAILSASYTLWLINLLIPAICGGLIMLFSKETFSIRQLVSKKSQPEKESVTT